MVRKKQLRKQCLELIDDLFSGELDEEAILAKHKISRRVYNRWLTDNRFEEEFARRLAAAYRQSELIIAKYAPLAAAKLVQLTESEKEETARKACLDIISLPMLAGKGAGRPANAKNDDTKGRLQNISPKVAGKLLAVLAETEQKSSKGIREE